MPDTYVLSAEERKYYEDNGFLVISKLIEFDSLYTYKQRFLNICKGIVDKEIITVVRDPKLVAKGLKGEDAINKLQDIHFDDVFSRYTEHPRLLKVLAQLVGPALRVTNSMFINKPPGSPEHPMHQDLAYFPFRPADKIVASWTAVDHVTETNGGLYVVPGSHRGKLYEHGKLVGMLKLYHGIIEKVDLGPRVVLTMEPGDTVFFHPLLVHGSGANVAQGPCETVEYLQTYRKSIAAHYASEECHYIEVRGGPQAAVARDVEAEGRRRGYELGFTDIWRYKSKSITVAPSKL